MGMFGKLFKKKDADASVPEAPSSGSGELDPPPLPGDPGQQTDVQNVDAGMNPAFAGLEKEPGEMPVPEPSLPQEEVNANAIPDDISAEAPPAPEQVEPDTPPVPEQAGQEPIQQQPDFPPQPEGTQQDTADIESIKPFEDSAQQDMEAPEQKEDDSGISAPDIDLNADIESELGKLGDLTSEPAEDAFAEEPIAEPLNEPVIDEEIEEKEKDERLEYFKQRPYINVIRFQNIVKVMNSVSSESKVAEDAISRIEDINRDMETQYEIWQQNLESFERKIIKIDKTIYKG